MYRLALLIVGCLCLADVGSEEEVHSLDDTIPSVTDFEGLPSSLVNGSVCIISGSYTDHVIDAVLPGPEPLVFSRSYSSLQKMGGNLGISWSSNHRDEMAMKRRREEEDKDIWLMLLAQSSGARLAYKYPYEKHPKSHAVFRFKMECPKGLTNGGGNEISGKTNLRNLKVSYYPDKEKFITVSGAGGQTRVFQKRRARRRSFSLSSR